MEARYEWRVWAADLSELEAGVQLTATPIDDRRSGETYIVSKHTTSINAKTRDGLLDIKVLESTADGFERWEPLEKRPFPITERTAADLLSRLGIEARTDRASYTLRQLLEAMIEPVPRLRAVEVTKHRRLFRYAGCIVDLADVSIARAEFQSAAIESADLTALRSAAESLGLTAVPNVSYPKMIHRVLGWIDREE